MKFYGIGIVWNKDANKRLCRFKNGEFETENNEIIEKLIALGYKHEDSIEANTKEYEDFLGGENPFAGNEFINLSIEELKLAAKLKGIKGYATMKRETIIERLCKNE